MKVLVLEWKLKFYVYYILETIISRHFFCKSFTFYTLEMNMSYWTVQMHWQTTLQTQKGHALMQWQCVAGQWARLWHKEIITCFFMDALHLQVESPVFLQMLLKNWSQCWELQTTLDNSQLSTLGRKLLLVRTSLDPSLIHWNSPRY